MRTVDFILLLAQVDSYLGVHYPSDIIGGYFASGFWLSSAIWFFQKYKEKRFERKALSDCGAIIFFMASAFC